MKFSTIFSGLALLVAAASAIPRGASELSELMARKAHKCSLEEYCECNFSDGSRCATNDIDQDGFFGASDKCRCPDYSDVNSSAARTSVNCITSGEYGDRHKCPNQG